MLDNVNKEMSNLAMDQEQFDATLHPLQNEWTLFYVPPAETSNRTSSTFEKTGFNEIYTVKSVEEFWRYVFEGFIIKKSLFVEFFYRESI